MADRVPAPSTEAGQRLFPGRNLVQKFAAATLADILAIEEAARAEGRREAVRRLEHVDSAFTVFLAMQEKYHPTGGPAPSWIDFIRERASEVRAILDRVAGLNASESPPTHVHDWTASSQPGPWPGMPGSVCVAPGHVGDASESGQPPEASERKFRYIIPIEIEVEISEDDAFPQRTASQLAREFMQSFYPMSVSGGRGYAETKRVYAPKAKP